MTIHIEHLKEFREGEIPDLELYSLLISQCFKNFRDAIFPVRTTLYQEYFLETSIETLKANWSIFANSIKSCAIVNNSVIDPICNKIIETFKRLSENRINSQESIITLTSLIKFIEKILDNTVFCYSSFSSINDKLLSISYEAPEAAQKSIDAGNRGIARDITELNERIEALAIPFGKLVLQSKLIMEFWEKTIQGLTLTIEFYKTNSKDIDFFVNFDNPKKQNFKMIHTGTNNPMASIKSPITPSPVTAPTPIEEQITQTRSFFSFFSKKPEPSSIEKEIERRKAEKFNLRNKYKAALTINETYSNYGTNQFSRNRSDSTSTIRNSITVGDLSLSNYLANGGNTGQNKNSIERSNKQSISIVVPGKKSLSLSSQESEIKTSPFISNSLTRASKDSSRTIIPVPTDSIYWIAKKWGSVSSSNNEFVDNTIQLLEEYLK
ncbi:hypothetical protein AYI69_g5102 [Smittium culicis]|uniref:Uncharacterized protein n=1 Tax=Smittium culicis TaxID=133412 RepID=A0A1R1Y8D1_9FUNG|nr:hypothetical protein AYI69_g5102 [Smittium culicis]